MSIALKAGDNDQGGSSLFGRHHTGQTLLAWALDHDAFAKRCTALQHGPLHAIAKGERQSWHAEIGIGHSHPTKTVREKPVWIHSEYRFLAGCRFHRKA